jgi:hypothetical protein
MGCANRSTTSARCNYPTLLDLPAPHLRMYAGETVIAEKVEAMVQLGTLNTRVTDFSKFGC